jgi:hypothetical protein
MNNGERGPKRVHYCWRLWIRCGPFCWSAKGCDRCSGQKLSHQRELAVSKRNNVDPSILVVPTYALSVLPLAFFKGGIRDISKRFLNVNESGALAMLDFSLVRYLNYLRRPCGKNGHYWLVSI